MIQSDDLRTFSEIGQALWVDAGRCERSTVETLSAVSLLNLSPERAIEKACMALLESARRAGSGAEVIGNGRSSLLLSPFYRLSVEEKFMLVAVHIGRWSYHRIGRILEVESAQLQVGLWRSRMQLGPLLNPPAIYPGGAANIGADCPNYDPAAPWTQRFFDNEFPSGRDQLLLKQHLLKCSSCSQALQRSREFYFRVDTEIRRLVGTSTAWQELPRTLEKVLRLSPVHVARTERTLKEALIIFLARRETQISLTVLAAILLARIIKR